MRALPVALVVASLVPIAGTHDALAQVSDPIQYSLRAGSHLEWGCMGPCECAVIISNPLKGDFTFRRTSVDPLYSHYAMTNIDWVYTVGDSATGRAVHVHGEGTYDLGGEVAAMQRMVLDLTTDGTLAQHFDSGLVPVGAPFPVIDIDVHAHVNICIDTLIRVVAAPQGFVGATEPTVARLLGSPVPNPSGAAVELTFAPRSPGHANVDVIDVSGRVVAVLIDRSVAAGVYRVRWDGRNAAGGKAGPGIYWVRARLGDREERQRIARVR